MMDSDRPLALVTYASSGIGLELAKLFAADGHDLVVAAENGEIQMAGQGLGASGISVEAVQVDLATDECVDGLYRVIRAADRPVAAVVLNAGRGAGGAFTQTARSWRMRTGSFLAAHPRELAIGIPGGRVDGHLRRVPPPTRLTRIEPVGAPHHATGVEG